MSSCRNKKIGANIANMKDRNNESAVIHRTSVEALLEELYEGKVVSTFKGNEAFSSRVAF
jgi:hypothetical protein|uniref:Uncharacterized protein n=1 Tax=Geobacillus sp. (strain WCH70) TaxID=471223 RepID=C5D904_GEOSW